MAESTYTDCKNCSYPAPNRVQHTYAATDKFCMAYSNPDRCDWCMPAYLCHRYSSNTNRRCLHDTIVEMSALDRFRFWFLAMRPTPSAHIRSGPIDIFAYAAFRSACPDSSDKFQMFWCVVAWQGLVQLLPSPPMSYWWSNETRNWMRTLNIYIAHFESKKKITAEFESRQVWFLTSVICHDHDNSRLCNHKRLMNGNGENEKK